MVVSDFFDFHFENCSFSSRLIENRHRESMFLTIDFLFVCFFIFYDLLTKGFAFLQPSPAAENAPAMATPTPTKVPKSVSDKKRFFESAMEDQHKPTQKTGELVSNCKEKTTQQAHQTSKTSPVGSDRLGDALHPAAVPKYSSFLYTRGPNLGQIHQFAYAK